MTDRTEYLAARQASRTAHTAQHGLPAHVAHGVSAYNNWGCRCTICKQARNAYQRAYRKAKRDYLERHYLQARRAYGMTPEARASANAAIRDHFAEQAT